MAKTSNKRKSILVTTSTFPRWPRDKEPPFVFELCARLQERYDIHVLSPHFKGAAREEQIGGMRVTRFHYCPAQLESLAYQGGILANLKERPWKYSLVPGFMMSELLAMQEILRSRRIDLIHAHWMIPQGLVGILCRRLSKNPPPLVCTSHGSDLFGLNGRLMNLVKKWVLQESDSISVVSHGMRDEMEKLGIGRERIHVIPMGVDFQKQFVPPKTRKDGKFILFVGRLIRGKGLRLLLEAFRSVLRTFPDASLTIAGTGPEDETLKALCAESGITDKVTFLGAVEHGDLPFLYGKTDVVVFPSVASEGFGMVLAEALGCECAVLASDLPSTRDLIVDGKTGLVFPRGDVVQLADGLKKLLADPGLRKVLGKAGRRSIKERLDWSVIIGRYFELFESLMGGR